MANINAIVFVALSEAFDIKGEVIDVARTPELSVNAKNPIIPITWMTIESGRAGWPFRSWLRETPAAVCELIWKYAAGYNVRKVCSNRIIHMFRVQYRGVNAF